MKSPHLVRSGQVDEVIGKRETATEGLEITEGDDLKLRGVGVVSRFRDRDTITTEGHERNGENPQTASFVPVLDPLNDQPSR